MKAQTAFGILLLLSAGCILNPSYPRHHGKGDAGAFILQKALQFGGEPRRTNNLPAIEGTWRYMASDSEIGIRLPATSSNSVYRFVNQAFGEADGSFQGYVVHRFSERGGGVLHATDSRHTAVLVLRPYTEAEAKEFLDQDLSSILSEEYPIFPKRR